MIAHPALSHFLRTPEPKHPPTANPGVLVMLVRVVGAIHRACFRIG